MHLLGWVFLGLGAGVLARLVTPGREPGGCIVTILLGIAGALLAGYVGVAAGWYQPEQRAGFFAATLGAIVILVIYRLLRSRS